MRHISRKLAFLPPLLPAFLAAFICLADPSVRADNAVTVPALHIVNLAPSAGKFMNVFYVSAQDPKFGTPGAQLIVNAILAGPERVQIGDNGVIDLPAMRVPPAHFKLFNYLYLAVTADQPDPLYLRNLNADVRVLDPRATPDELDQKPESAFASLSSGFVSARTLPTLKRVGTEVEIDYAGPAIHR